MEKEQITTIFKGNKNKKVFTKVIKMPNQKASVQRPSGPIKIGQEAQAL